MKNNLCPFLPPFLLLSAGAVAQAQKVEVSPDGRCYFAEPQPGASSSNLTLDQQQAPYQFKALLTGGQKQPFNWNWSVVGLDEHSSVANGGKITSNGVYIPPTVALTDYLAVRIKAAHPGDARLFGTVVVVIRPAPSVSPSGQLPRVEFLTGDGFPIDPRVPFAHSQRSMVDEEPHAASFDFADALAYAPRIPRPDHSLKNQWLLADGPRVHAVGDNGRVNTLGRCPAQGHPLFSAVAVKPWAGPESGAWEAYLWEGVSKSLWKMGPDGTFTKVPGNPATAEGFLPEAGPAGESTALGGLAVDGKGNVFLALTTYLAANGGSTPCLREFTPGKGWSTLAGGYKRKPGGDRDDESADGIGEKANFVRIYGMALDESDGTLYVLDREKPDATSAGCIRAVDLKNRKVTTLHLHALDSGSGSVPMGAWEASGLAYHQGWLFTRAQVGRGYGRVLAMEVKSGLSQVVFQDAKDTRALMTGPDRRAASGLPKELCGSMGPSSPLAVGKDGRLGFISADQKAGLLLLDWKAFGSAK